MRRNRMFQLGRLLKPAMGCTPRRPRRVRRPRPTMGCTPRRPR